ncbi:hypothetical protein OTU49_012813, partial [Cherax quadricarinatus]
LHFLILRKWEVLFDSTYVYSQCLSFTSSVYYLQAVCIIYKQCVLFTSSVYYLQAVCIIYKQCVLFTSSVYYIQAVCITFKQQRVLSRHLSGSVSCVNLNKNMSKKKNSLNVFKSFC